MQQWIRKEINMNNKKKEPITYNITIHSFGENEYTVDFTSNPEMSEKATDKLYMQLIKTYAAIGQEMVKSVEHRNLTDRELDEITFKKAQQVLNCILLDIPLPTDLSHYISRWKAQALFKRNITQTKLVKYSFTLDNNNNLI